MKRFIRDLVGLIVDIGRLFHAAAWLVVNRIR